MKVLSKGTVYGLRALVYLATQKDRTGYVSIGEISEKLDISFHFLTKTFQMLTQKGILESYRGPSGGIALNKPAEQIFLFDIVKILEGDDFFDKCLLGLPGCGDFEPCPVHDFWKVAKAALKNEFEITSLAELGAKVTDERLRLSA
ncbi:MAG: Rrf2 family transcriptional regulator [Saprospiraceae bacterium]|nr:Rrf2 family transcriptional regulator [Saprospiraceae bacterium]MCF8249028.1 Rrf2 family transcriptional regulator [Saprospiraceae bacterium]MCF8282414.1 Rrf2 family transcriptional regulator [Bacteroidales bacterium]MCF8310922.1 Rrf2 family transcriptional regulator [Saprospiraceae bacterium]MCF8439490.1 Rrf2 family transcriptional regulator [Saprospiraceae bacterium]